MESGTTTQPLPEGDMIPLPGPQKMFYNRPRNHGFMRVRATKCFTIRSAKSLKLR
jgi:hypothetical protein